jgi:hypothetical protein
MKKDGKELDASTCLPHGWKTELYMVLREDNGGMPNVIPDQVIIQNDEHENILLENWFTFPQA